MIKQFKILSDFIRNNAIYTIIALFLSFFVSCDDNSVQVSKPELFSIEPTTTYIGGLLTIYGNNLGYNPDSSYVVFDSVLYIPAKNCIKWNNTTIKLIIPDSAKSGKIWVICNNKDTTNSLDIIIEKLPELQMLSIPAGTFQMGSSTGNTNEQPLHNVNIKHSLLFSKFEIQQYFWTLVMGTNPSIYIGDNLPVHNITWNDAVLFCNKLSNILGYDSCYIFDNENYTINYEANGFRLPTEAEWEYACRAGSTGDFYNNHSPADIAWYSYSSGLMPHPVGQKKPNSFGLHDIQGNVWEWCNDWFSDSYYNISPNDNPKGPLTGSRKVIRGGSFADGIFYIRTSNRSIPWETIEIKYCGLRVVRKAE